MDDTTTPGRRVALRIAAVGLIALSGVAGLVVARWMRAPVNAHTDKPAVVFPKGLFKDWSTPDVVLVLTGQQGGYLGPCGCSEPQIGGLERRYNLLKLFEQASWPAVPVDLGDVPQTSGPAGLRNQQGVIKYRYAMKAMREMKYAGVGFGRNETQVGLLGLLGEYSLNNPEPRVVIANLIDAESNFPDMTKSWNYADTRAGLRVGVTTVVGPSVAGDIKAQADPSLRFGVTDKTLDNVLKQMNAGKVGLPVLLFQGPLEPAGAKACAEAYPQFPVVLCLGDDAPPAKPTLVRTKDGGDSLVVQVGIKGKFVGVVGAWKTAKGFDFKYERVEMTEDFLTPKEKRKDHPIVKLLEQYTAELKDKDYLAKYAQMKHPLQAMDAVAGLAKPGEADYIGSEACKKCHADAYDIWKESKHGKDAYKTLVEAEHPKNRQYDPECIVCHTVGFGYKTGFESETKTPKLKDVGCESCHGPSGLHARNPNNEDWKKRINPWRHLPAANRQAAMDQMCQKCHDQENDVHWLNNAFPRKWKKVEHYTPKPEE